MVVDERTVSVGDRAACQSVRMRLWMCAWMKNYLLATFNKSAWKPRDQIHSVAEAEAYSSHQNLLGIFRSRRSSRKSRRATVDSGSKAKSSEWRTHIWLIPIPLTREMGQMVDASLRPFVLLVVLLQLLSPKSFLVVVVGVFVMPPTNSRDMTRWWSTCCSAELGKEEQS